MKIKHHFELVADNDIERTPRKRWEHSVYLNGLAVPKPKVHLRNTSYVRHRSYEPFLASLYGDHMSTENVFSNLDFENVISRPSHDIRSAWDNLLDGEIQHRDRTPSAEKLQSILETNFARPTNITADSKTLSKQELAGQCSMERAYDLGFLNVAPAPDQP